MRQWLHVCITLALELLCYILGCALCFGLAWRLLDAGVTKLLPYLGLAAMLFIWIALGSVNRVMMLLASRCPACSRSAHYCFVAWRWKRSLIPSREYGYHCDHCGWKSYQDD